MLRRTLSIVIIALLSLAQFSVVGAQDALYRSRTIKFQTRVKSASMGYFTGTFPVTVGLYKAISEPGKPKRWEGPIWSEFHPAVKFTDGLFTMDVGALASKPLTAKLLGQPRLEVGLQIADETFYFPMSSIPYSVQSGIAESVLSADAARLLPGSVFKAVTLNAALSVGDKGSAVFVNTKSKTVKIGGKNDAGYKLNVNGDLNAHQIYIQGVPIADTFDWQRNKVVSQDIYFLGEGNRGSLGIHDKSPLHRVSVEGVVNMGTMLKNGRPVSAGFEWQRFGNDLVFVPKDKKLGLGTIDPADRLDVQEGVLMSHRHDLAAPLLPGVVWFECNKFWGFNGVTTNKLIGIEGVGAANRISVWDNSARLTNSLSFVWKDKKMGVGTSLPTSLLSLATSETVDGIRIVSGNDTLFFESPSGRFVFGVAQIPPKGFMGIDGFTNLNDETAQSKSTRVFNELVEKGFLDSKGHISPLFTPEITTFNLGLTSIPDESIEPLIIARILSYRNGRVPDSYLYTTANYKIDDFNLNVNGSMSGSDLRIYGLPLRFAISRGSEFLSDRTNLEDTRSNVFYMKGNVSIGQPESDNLLQIASPFNEKDIDVPTKDPVLGFRYSQDGHMASYLFGVDADGPGVLRVEKAEKLGDGKPLFVALQNQFGVGTLLPKSNLHVSGNYGFIVKGQLGVSPSLSVKGPGTRMLFQADKGAFRVGNVSNTSVLSGADWDPEYIGEFSMAMGKDLVASGNYSAAIGGSKSVVDGAYSATLGGNSNNIQGFFAVGLGSEAVIPKKQHGSFVWADKALISSGSNPMSSTAFNQFLIRSQLGVGIGTNDTLDSALTVQGRPVLKADFMRIFPDSEDIVASSQLWTALKDDNYISSDGYFNKFMPRYSFSNVVQVFPVTFLIDSTQLYNFLAGKYRSNSSVLKTDFQSILNLDSSRLTFSKAIWTENEKSLRSLDIWKWLVAKRILKSDSSFDLFNPLTDGPSVVAGSNLVNDDNALYGFLVSKYPGKVSSVAFKDLVKSSFYVDPAFDNWISLTAKKQASSMVFSDLVSQRMIRSNGRFDLFRPIFDFNRTVFNGQRVSTTNIFNVLLGIYDQNIIRTYGNKNLNATLISNSGQMAVGYSDPGSAIFSVNGPLSIGTKEVLGKLTIESKDVSPNLVSKNYAFAVFSSSDRVTPSFVINTRGMVGVKQFHDQMATNRFKPSDNVLLSVDGAVIASGFKFPTGESLSVKPPHIDWLYENTTPNIYFVSGNVGIGTISPNSLLELSNADLQHPQVGFDLNGTDYYAFGMMQTDPSTFRLSSSSQMSTKTPDLVVKNNFVGINTVVPSGSLHVSGNVVVDKFLVATDNRGVALGRSRLVYAKTFLRKGTLVVDWVWGKNDGPEYIYTLPNEMKVGIGVSRPIISKTSEGIDVGGTTSANSIVISKTMEAKDGVSLKSLTLKEGFVNGNLFVKKKALWLGFGGVPLSVSEILSYGKGVSGNVAVWDAAHSNVIGRTPMIWQENVSKVVKPGYTVQDAAFKYDTVNKRWTWNSLYDYSHPGSIAITGNVSIKKSQTFKSLDIQNDIELGIDRATDQFHIDTSLTYEGGFFDKSQSFSVTSINIRTASNVSGNGKQVIGSLVTLDTASDSFGRKSYLTSQATAFGLSSDVSKVNAQVGGPTTRGYKFPAIFMGDVGIGGYPERDSTLDPKYSVLEVKGPLQAISFDITDRLLISTINVSGKVLVVDPRGKVGINVDSPRFPLQINGDAYITDLKVNNGAQSSFMTAKTNRFVVNQDGFVGIGVTGPTTGLEQFEINKTVSKPLASEFNFEKMNVTLSGGGAQNKNITGLDMTIGSKSDRNIFVSGAVAKGIDVGFTGISKVVTGSSLIGVRSETTSTYNAIFRGGAVGIGTTTPRSGYLLDVQGSIRAHDLISTPLTRQPDGARFSKLIVKDFGNFSSSSQVTMNTGYVNNLILKDVNISQLSNFSVGLDVRNTLTASVVSVNSITTVNSLVSNAVLKAKKGVFTDKLIVGRELPDVDVLSVSGGFESVNITVNRELDAGSLVVSSSRKVLVDTSYHMGIRVTTPSAGIDSLVAAPEYTISAFSAGDNRTWNGMRVQSDVSVAGRSAGVLFQPGNTVPVLGLLAVKQSGDASDLVVVAGSKEAIRLTSLGNLGIGQSLPTEKLSVVGSANVSEYLYVSGNVLALEVKGRDGLAVSGKMMLRTTADFSVLSTEKSLEVKPGLLNSRTGYVPFYIENTAQNYLNYSGYSLSPTINLVEGSIPFYDVSGLSGVSTLHKWDESNRQYVLGSPRSIIASAGTQNIVSFVQKSIQVPFLNRLTGSSTVFYGEHVYANGTALHTNDVFRGVNVDLSQLRASSETRIGDVVYSTKGTKYAATFRGGSVGIAPQFSDATMRPSANLHVVSAISDVSALKVLNSALVVSRNGFVGVGQGIPAASLDVSGSVFIGDRGSNISGLDIRNGKVGIGGVATMPLDVRGTLKAKQGQFVKFQPKEIQVATSGLVVKSSGFVGLGTSSPEAQLHSVKTLTGSETNNFSQETLGLDYYHDVTVQNTALLLDMGTRANNIFGGDKTIRGMRFDYSATAGTGSKVLGVVVGTNSNSTRDVTAVFQGGNVGIGVTAPGYTLDVDGDIKGKGFSYTNNASSLVVQSATANSSVYVSGDVKIVGDFDDSRSHLFTNHLLFREQSGGRNLLSQIGSSPDLAMDYLKTKSGFVSGNVTVGTTHRGLDRFNVVGNAIVTKNLTVRGSSYITISDWDSLGTTTISAPQFSTNGFLYSANDVFAKKLQIIPSVTPNFNGAYGQLFISKNDKNLYYLGEASGQIITINLTSRGIGTSYAIPFFNAGDLRADNFIQFKNSELIVGANPNSVIYGPRQSMVLVDSFLGKQAITKETVEDVRVGFTRRVKGENGNLGTLDFSAMSVAVTGDATLRAEDRLVGVSVNVTKLIAQSRSEDLDGEYYLGEKYPALFLGGSVMVVTSGNRMTSGASSANLHIRNNSTKDLAMMVKDTALVVSVNFGVGVGTSDPRAALDVNNEMKVRAEQNSLVISGGKVGIGRVAQTPLEVSGTLQANYLRAKVFQAGEMAIATKGLVVKSNGFVGMGLTNPSAQFDVEKRLDGSLNSGYTFESLYMSLKKTSAPKEIIADNTALYLGIKTAANNTFGNSNKAVGFSIKQPLPAETGSKVIGVDVLMNESSTRNVAAILKGGNVGIGVENPEYTLDVDGDFSAKNMILTDRLLSSSFQSVTVNNLVVTSDANFPNAVFVLKGQNLIRVKELRFRLQNTPVNFLATATKNSMLDMDAMDAKSGRLPATVNVGVASNSFLSKTFHVGGSALVEGSVSMNGSQAISGMTKMGGSSPITVSADRFYVNPTGVTTIEGFNNMPGLIMPSVFVRNTSIGSNKKGFLYVSSASTLNYVTKKSNNVTSVNIVSIALEKGSMYANTLPYFNAIKMQYEATSANNKTKVVWKNSALTLSAPAATVTVSAIVSEVKPSDATLLPLGSVHMEFDRRTAPSSLEFVGMNVVVSENGKNRRSVLPSTGKVIGLKVDMNNLYDKSRTERPVDLGRTLEGHKYAAIFKGAGVGIVSTTNQTRSLALFESLHVSANRQTDSLPFMVESKDFAGVQHFGITVTQDGTVALGFNPIGSVYNIGKTIQLDTLGLSLKSSDSTNVFFVTSNVGVGVSRPAAKLAVFGNGTQDALIIGTATTPNVLSIKSKGQVAIGGSKDTSVFSVSGNIKTVFQVSGQNTNSFFVQQNGQVRILFDTEPSSASTYPFALTVSGNTKDNAIVMSGSDVSANYLMLRSKGLAPDKRPKDYFSAGFVAALGTKTTAFGIASMNARLTTSANRLVFANFDGSTSVPVMTVITNRNNKSKTPQIGLYTENPQASVHLAGLTGQSIFQVTPTTNWGLKGLDITETGGIHIGTTSSKSQLMVSGSMMVYSITETPSRNTTFKTVSMTVSPNGFVNASPLNVTPSITDGKGHTALDATVVLDRDLQRSNMTYQNGRLSLIGLEVSMNSKTTTKLFGNDAANGSHSAYGLKVDVSDLTIGDPTFGSSAGKYAAAVFLSTFGTGADLMPDATVGIGTNAPSAPLEVKAIDGKGNVHTTGDIVTFSTDKNYLEGAPLNYGTMMSFYVFKPTSNVREQKLSDMTNTLYRFNLGNGAADIDVATYKAVLGRDKSLSYPMLTPESFESIVYYQKDDSGTYVEHTVDYEDAIALQDLLRDEGVLTDVKERLYVGASSSTRIGSIIRNNTLPNLAKNYYEVGSLFVPGASIRAVLNQYFYRSIYSFKSLDPDDTEGDLVNTPGFSRPSPTYNTLVIASGTRPLVGMNGFVNSVLINGGIDRTGVGAATLPESGLSSTYYFREALQVSGSMRLGTTPAFSAMGAPGGGSMLYFSGGPKLGSSSLDDSENTDEMTVRRYNESSGKNSLKFSIGEKSTAADASFMVGISSSFNSQITDNYKSKFVVKAYSLTHVDDTGLLPEGITDPATGFVGIGTTHPEALLHIYGKQADGETMLDSQNRSIPKPMVLLENLAEKRGSFAASANTLCIRYSKASMESGDNFMTFLIKSDAVGQLDSLGAIEGNPAGSYTYTDTTGATQEVEYEGVGVAYSSPERDYAEYVEKLDPKETFEKGEVVGIFGGKLSHKTAGADHVVVISSTPIVVGNWQTVNLDHYGLVAFLGQVPVRVKGIVHKGDYLIPSGANDGTAIAISPSEVTAEVIDKIVGRSWNESNDVQEKKILSIIGFPFGLEGFEGQLSALKKDVSALSVSTAALETELSTRYEKRQQLISDLKKRMAEIKN